VQATTRFVLAIYQSPLLQSLATEVGQFAYLIAVLSWTWTILRRDPVPAPPSAESLERMQQLAAGDDVVPKERIFAAVGIKVSRPEEDGPEKTAEQQAGERRPKLPA
jgi:hypothetical protein